MGLEFEVIREPSEGLLAEVGASAATNPFYTSAYVRARAAMGEQPWLLVVRQDGALAAGCTAFLRRGRINRTLSIESLPELGGDRGGPFWSGLSGACRRAGVTRLDVGSHASPPVAIPGLDGEVQRSTFTEYLIPLDGPDPAEQYSKNHARNIRRARKTGLRIHRGGGDREVLEHCRLIGESMGRRRARGERVPDGTAEGPIASLVRCGAGELVQVRSGSQVLSSLLLLQAPNGAYYHSAGTSPEGMSLGSSHLLIDEIITQLRDSGRATFNLGGASRDEAGLSRFKLGFGATPRTLQAATFAIGPAWRRKVGTAARLIRDDPKGLWRALIKIETFAVFETEARGGPADADQDAPADAGAGEPPRFAQLLPDDLPRDERIADELAILRSHVEQFGDRGLFGVYLGDEVAHVGCLVDHEMDARIEVRNLGLRAGEAEITHCVTHPDYRGRGLYPFAVRALCHVAHERGIRHLYMMSNIKNPASIRGIEKSGLRRRGTVYRVVFPLLPGSPGMPFRAYRWHRRTPDRPATSRQEPLC